MTTKDFMDLKKRLIELDREYGPKVQDVKYFKYPDVEFSAAVVDTQKYFRELVRALNCVDKDVDMSGIVHLSKLGWMNNMPMDIDSKTYRCRFLTLLITEIADHLGDLCTKMYRYYSPGTGIYEHAYFYMIEVKNNVRNFITKFIDGNDWSNEILTILDYTYFLRGKKKVKTENLINGTRNVIRELREGCYQERFVKPLLDDNMIIDYIFRAAVFMCNNAGECEDVPKKKDYKKKILGVDNYQYEIAYIGKVLVTNPGDFRKMSLGFQIFEDANPKIWNGIKERDSNPWLSMGCAAIEYVGFILNSNCCSEIIDKLLERPGWSN